MGPNIYRFGKIFKYEISKLSNAKKTVKKRTKIVIIRHLIFNLNLIIKKLRDPLLRTSMFGAWKSPKSIPDFKPIGPCNLEN